MDENVSDELLTRAVWLFKSFSQDLRATTWNDLSGTRKQYWITSARNIPTLTAPASPPSSVGEEATDAEEIIEQTFVQSWDQHIGQDGAIAITNELKKRGCIIVRASVTP